MSKKLLKKGQTPDQYQTQLYDRITKIQTEVLTKIQKLKANAKSYVCQHFKMESDKCQPYNQQTNYYDKFWKMFLFNEIGKLNYIQFQKKNQKFQKSLDKIKQLFEQWQQQLAPILKTKKRHRDNSIQVFKCPSCDKKYSDYMTLNTHIQIKHMYNSQTSKKVKRQHQQMQIFQQDNQE